MSLGSTNYRKTYTGDASTTIFPYDFYILESTHIAVYLDNVLQTTGYSVSGAGNPAGGNVTFTTAPGSGVDVTLVRSVPLTQALDYQEGTNFPASSHEAGLDKLTMIAQQLQELLDRSYKLPTEETGTAAKVTLPAVAARLSKYFGWDSSGNPTALAAPTGTSTTTAFTQTLLDDANAAAVIATLNADGVLTPSQITANQNDYNPTSLSTSHILRLSSDATRIITGLAGGVAGRVVILFNVGSFALHLANDDAGSAAANRIMVGPNTMAIAPNESVRLWYDGTSSRWRVVGFPCLLTNHGDILARATSGPVRVPVGANGKVLFADSTASGGVDWATRATQGWSVHGNNSRNNSGTPTTKYDLTCSDVGFWEPASGNSYFKRAVSTLTVDTGVAGPAVNGRDQAGAFSSNQWLYFYAIYNPGSDTVAGIVSLTGPSSGPTLPSGYTAWAYFGAVRWNGSSNLVPTRMAGNWRYYETEQSALSGGTATTETAVSLTSLIPATASRFQIGGAMTLQSTSGHVKLRTISGSDARLVYGFAASGETNVTGWGDLILPNISQQFYYLWSSAITARSFDAMLYGYEEVLTRG